LTFMITLLSFSTLLVVFFFNIPRYQIQMSVVIIPTSMYGFYFLFRKLFNKNKLFKNNECTI
jgi:hypothetical protein